MSFASIVKSFIAPVSTYTVLRGGEAAVAAIRKRMAKKKDTKDKDKAKK